MLVIKAPTLGVWVVVLKLMAEAGVVYFSLVLCRVSEFRDSSFGFRV